MSPTISSCLTSLFALLAAGGKRMTCLINGDSGGVLDPATFLGGARR